MIAAQKRLELTPGSADAYALMMRVYRLSGDFSTALKYGNRAMDINELDGSNISAFASLLSDMKRTQEAEKMRKQASLLTSTYSGSSL